MIATFSGHTHSLITCGTVFHEIIINTVFLLFSYICHKPAFSYISLFNKPAHVLRYGKCSKPLNTSCLPKRPRHSTDSDQTVSSRLKEQSNRGLPVCYSDKLFVNFSCENQHYIQEHREKC